MTAGDQNPRVIQLISDLGNGGAQQLLSEMARLWATSVFDYSLIYLRSEEADPRRFEKHGIFPRCVPIRSPFDVTGFCRLYREINRLRPSVLHTHLTGADICGRAIGAWQGIPVVVTALHSLAGHYGVQNPRRYSLRPVLFRQVLPRRFEALVACGKMVHESFRDLSREDLLLRQVANGLSFESVNPLSEVQRHEKRAGLQIADSALVVLCVARLARVKGVDMLIEAAEKLASLAPNACFLVAGDGPERGSLERAIVEAARA